MKDAEFNLLDGKGYEIIELLQGLNVPRTESICIACLVCGNELTSQGIERASGLRQPEVSIAMRPLRDRKWIEERNEKKNNDKGRPLKYYKLIVTFDHIVEIFENEVLKKNREIEEALEQLKELSSGS
ncbi:transcriptional regulator [Methanolobus halotolerans]|uniref:Transcriptional regulator n=1 Tax=Methanolobus halotolerans TaxID=2052935 RepID=A0A4E0Q6G5_9EURY|nr:transcriptional regulator [Methanolobus halotolerans]TGC09703.1 transcriptional regulator [Methanolobus halotolerans]